MSFYYKLLNKKTLENDVVIANYCSTQHTQGAWNPNEQHMGPASAILTAELESFAPRSEMRLARLSFDIFGLISAGEFTITTKIIRPGKTIELLEAEMQSNGVTCIVARAWRMATQDSREITGLEDKVTAHPDTLEPWQGMQRWPGGYVQSIEAKIEKNHRPGKGIVWLKSHKLLIEGQETSDFTQLMSLVDTANGVVQRQEEKITWAFPNLDLQVHLYRYPTGEWLGIEGTQQYGADGIGLTSAILHDINGPFGHSEQILTLRKIAEG